MRRVLKSGWVAIATFVGIFGMAAPARAVDLNQWIEQVKGIGPEGQGYEKAIPAIKRLSAEPPASIPGILKGMNGANRLAENWLRSAVEASADKGPLPVAEIRKFLDNRKNSQRARRLAFELLTEAEPDRKNAMLVEMLDDPSLEIRRDAVELELSKVRETSAKADRIRGFRTALVHAREIQQIKSIAEALSELGEEVDLTRHFGMVMNWHLIGPFPNKDQARFDAVDPPEKKIDLSASYEGELGKVSWISHQSTEDEGIVDLNKALSNHKGAIAYAFAEFVSAADQEVDVRLGCINANKVWVNGELIISNNVYHAGMNLDQYIGKARLKSGTNRILIKVCQNEQKEAWAQRWQFQFRISDATGKAIVSK